MQAINTNNSRTQPNFDVLSIDCTTHDELLIEASMQNSQQILKFQPKHWRMKSVKVMSQQRDQNQNPTNTNYTLFRQFNYKLSSFLPAMPRALSNLSQTFVNLSSKIAFVSSTVISTSCKFEFDFIFIWLLS